VAGLTSSSLAYRQHIQQQPEIKNRSASDGITGNTIMQRTPLPRQLVALFFFFTRLLSFSLTKLNSTRLNSTPRTKAQQPEKCTPFFTKKKQKKKQKR
jgi:hypothetical protein